MRSTLVFLAFAAICTMIAFIGAKATTPEIPHWYARINKPSWTPPRLAFPIVWPILYAMIAVAGWRLWEAPSSDLRTAALIAFAVQLALNAVWSPVFFAAHRILAGLVVIVLLDAAIVATIWMSWDVQRWTSFLLLPYLAWTIFATALNARIWTLNRDAVAV